MSSSTSSSDRGEGGGGLRALGRLLIRHGAAALVAAILVLGTVELILSVHDFHLTDPRLVLAKREQGIDIAAGRPWKPSEFWNEIRANREGFRGPEFDADPVRTFRVGVVGDSFIEARQVPYGQTMHAVAEARLPGVRVLPLAVGNRPLLVRIDEFERIRDEILPGEGRYPPLDAVVFQLRSQSLQDSGQGGWRNRVLRKLTRRSGLDGALLEVGRSRLSSLSLLAHRVRIWIRYSRSSKAVTPGELVAGMRDRAERAVARMRETTRENGLPVGILWLPNAREATGLTLGVADRETDAKVILERAAESAGIAFEDASDRIPGPEVYFAIDGHPNRKGQEIVGECLVSLIRRLRR